MKNKMRRRRRMKDEEGTRIRIKHATCQHFNNNLLKERDERFACVKYVIMFSTYNIMCGLCPRSS